MAASRRAERILGHVTTNVEDGVFGQEKMMEDDLVQSLSRQPLAACNCGSAGGAGHFTRYEAQQFGEKLVKTTSNTIPVPTGEEVLVRVQYCGVCHSDVHIHDGYFDLGSSKQQLPKQLLPVVLGHEVAGEVAAVGPAVGGAIAIGTKVVCHAWIGCGRVDSCAFCAGGNEHLCPTGRTLGNAKPGGFGAYVLLPHRRYAVPARGVPLPLACTYACSGVTAYAALAKLKHLNPQDSRNGVLLIGLGGVGHTALQLFRSMFNGRLPSVADIDPQRLALAKELGCPTVLNAKDQDVLKSAVKLQAAAAVDFVGSPATFELAHTAVRRGGTVVVVGLFGGELRLGVPRIPLKALTIQGSFVGSVADLESVIDIAARGALQPIPIHVRPAAQANEALDDLKNGRVIGRIVLQHE